MESTGLIESFKFTTKDFLDAISEEGWKIIQKDIVKKINEAEIRNTKFFKYDDTFDSTGTIEVLVSG